ncbi:MAG: 50S ribosomal protein L17 [Bacteroidetes bacterium]|nr:50S ribosomal protein L17 [Bacteroidota bacterium]
MIHRRVGRKLKRTASHRKAMLCNMASSLFQHKKISTTEAKAKELRPFAEALITRAKHALQREQQGQLPTGQVIDIHNRREVYKSIRNKGVVQELFDTIAPAVATRPGGYTRIVKLGTRRGDAGKIAIIELVDFAASRDGIIRTRRKKTTKPTVTKSAPAPMVVTAVEEEVIEAPVADVVEVPVEVVEIPEEIVETPAEVEVIASNSEDVTAEVEITSPAEEVIAEATPESSEVISDEISTDESPEEPKAEA